MSNTAFGIVVLLLSFGLFVFWAVRQDRKSRITKKDLDKAYGHDTVVAIHDVTKRPSTREIKKRLGMSNSNAGSSSRRADDGSMLLAQTALLSSMDSSYSSSCAESPSSDYGGSSYDSGGGFGGGGSDGGGGGCDF